MTPASVTREPGTPTAANELRIATLKERAKRLAQQERKSAPGEQLDLIVFRLMMEHYAIETRFVREVYPLRNLTLIPCTPAFFLGVINVRGELCPVIDLKRLLDLPHGALVNAAHAVIVKDHAMEVAVAADMIVGERKIAVDEIGPPPVALPEFNANVMRGVTQDQLVVLDMAKILAYPAMSVNEYVEAI